MTATYLALKQRLAAQPRTWLVNGVVNLINRMPADAYRHAILALTEVTDFKRRIVRDDVCYISLNKPPGYLFRLFPPV